MLCDNKAMYYFNKALLYFKWYVVFDLKVRYIKITEKVKNARKYSLRQIYYEDNFIYH